MSWASVNCVGLKKNQPPSWFVREFMTVPKRAACRNWEKQAIYADDFEEIEDCPDFGRKPHVYYW